MCKYARIKLYDFTVMESEEKRENERQTSFRYGGSDIVYDPGDSLVICREFWECVLCDISVPFSSFVYDPGPIRLSALMVWGLLVGSPLCKCPLPLSSTTSALKTHCVQAPQDMKLKLYSSYLYGNGSPQLISDQLMTCYILLRQSVVTAAGA